jgi:hypothetical protein
MALVLNNCAALRPHITDAIQHSSSPVLVPRLLTESKRRESESSREAEMVATAIVPLRSVVSAAARGEAGCGELRWRRKRRAWAAAGAWPRGSCCRDSPDLEKAARSFRCQWILRPLVSPPRCWRCGVPYGEVHASGWRNRRQCAQAAAGDAACPAADGSVPSRRHRIRRGLVMKRALPP